MRGAALPFFCSLILLTGKAGESLKFQQEFEETPSSERALASPPEETSTARTLSEREIRSELKSRQRHIDEEKAILRRMFDNRNFSGGTELFRAVESDRRRISLLKRKLKEVRGKLTEAEVATAQ